MATKQENVNDEAKLKEEEEAKAKAEAETKLKEEEEAKAKVETEVKLKVLIAFTDKYTNEKYKVNDIISVDEKRAKELLTDPRRLVNKN